MVGKKIKKVAFFVVFLILSTSVPVAAQNEQDGEQQETLTTENEAQRELQNLVASKQDKYSQIREIRSAEQVLEEEISRLEQEIKNVEEELFKAEASIRRTERIQIRRQREIDVLENQIEALRVLMRQRAVEVYMDSGNQSLIENFLSSSDGSVFEMRKVFVDFANRKNNEIIEEMNRSKEELAEKKRKNSEILESLRSQREILQQRNNDLNKSREDVALRRAQLEAIGADIVNEVRLLQGEENFLLEILGYDSLPGDVPLFSDAPASASGLIWPTEGVLTSHFGMRWGAMHQGIDIGAPTGTPIYAANDGRVIFSGTQGGYGKIIIIDHGEGFHTAYAHQSRLVSVAGDSVQRGQIIGLVGSTGNSTGPHLHFETRINGSPVNPLMLLEG